MFYVLIVVAFLLNGDPVPLIKVMPLDCGGDDAIALAHENSVSTGNAIQDTVLWDCKPVTGPGPQRHIPGKDEALF